jgi:hypothetical protein
MSKRKHARIEHRRHSGSRLVRLVQLPIDVSPLAESDVKHSTRGTRMTGNPFSFRGRIGRAEALIGAIG